MTLRLKIHLIVGLLTLLFLFAMLALQLRSMRESVNEEVVAANRVAAQFLNRTVWRYAAQGTPAVLGFLQSMGRVRSNDITLVDKQGEVLYSSPVSPYKSGRDAPDWFDALVAPPLAVQSLDLPDGKLTVQANASRAVLDAWDEAITLVLGAIVMLVVLNGLVYWLVGRTLRPFGQIVRASTSWKAAASTSPCRPCLAPRPAPSARPSTAWWACCKTTLKPSAAQCAPSCSCRKAASSPAGSTTRSSRSAT